MVLAAAGLFVLLDSRRQSLSSQARLPVSTADGGMISAPPELVIPAGPGPAAEPGQPTVGSLPGLSRGIGGGVDAALPRVPGGVARTLPGVPRTPNLRGYYPGPPVVPPIVYSGTDPNRPARAQPDQPTPGGPAASGRVAATRFANPALTVPQGAIIQAVLETALDSNRAGFARAIVSRDIRGFDGSRVLIPRGSRLFGEYKSDLSPGQNRVLIEWQRLTRPDGAQIELASPAADTLGQAGVRGKVNSHFLARFGSSILQSALDIGVGVATRSATGGTYIVSLPGSSQSVTVPGQENVRPTLTIKQGTSVAVFTARDLDFSTVEP
jgi:type IV secretion system protein VirB10